ncbi:hypothetical protein I8748_05485 [Nostoc sp. CENA67]|uniref:Uncharacterized protein n=1 Tax=Amazonocrinis nigriterrae CENA67 TaxID=2794033 RepID=A0A8J7HQG6_9NOST|nr:hypothetical protein [Amazonocrinis nigriterrae]MBH8561635.1 hypothetical protein [Amazonocrinis nigriterrae CENA67]
MKCVLCNSDTWLDDDLHRSWCKNNHCRNSWGGDRERMRDFGLEIERMRREREDGYSDIYDIDERLI